MRFFAPISVLRRGGARALAAAALAVALSLPGQHRFGSIAPAATVAEAAQGNQGLSGGWAIDNLGQVNFVHSSSVQFPIIQQAGAGWVRVNFRLGDAHDGVKCFQDWTTPGSTPGCAQDLAGRTALEVYDDVVKNALGNNLKVLGLISSESWIGGQDLWTEQNAEHVPGGTGDNQYAKDFAQHAAGELATHFKGRVDTWEVWNEPNAWTSHDTTTNTYSGGTFLYPSNYAWLLKRSSAAIKAPAANPNASVIFGGLFAHEPMGGAATVMVNGTPQQVTKRGNYTSPDRPAPGNGGAIDGGRNGSNESSAGGPTKSNGAAAAAVSPAATVNCTSTVPNGADSGATYLCSTYDMGRTYAGWTGGAYPMDHIGQHLYLDQGGTTSSSKITTYLKDLRTAYVAYEGSKTLKKTHITEVGWQGGDPPQFSPDSLSVQAQNVRTAYSTFKRASYVGRAYWFSVQDVPEGGIFFGLVYSEGAQKPAFSAYRSAAAY